MKTGWELVRTRNLCCVAMSQGQGKCCYRTFDWNKGVAVAQLPTEVRLTKLVQLATTGLLYIRPSSGVCLLLGLLIQSYSFYSGLLDLHFRTKLDTRWPERRETNIKTLSVVTSHQTGTRQKRLSP